MKKVLVVEDSSTVTKILKYVFESQTEFEFLFVDSLKETKKQLEKNESEFFAAVVDLHLPDAPHGQAIELVRDSGIPTIVLTARIDENKRDLLISHGVVDYIIKESRYSYDYVTKLLKRLWSNQNTKVLVVEDSQVSLNHISKLLTNHLFKVVEATNGKEALKVLKANPDIKMVIADHHMPEMDGFELVKTIRHDYKNKDLIIIGLSTTQKGSLSAKFIKNGANDFLVKPFSEEEFHCRIIHNIETQELMDTIRRNAYSDSLTGLPNRRFFFEDGEKLWQTAKAKNQPIAIAVIDIDRFKQINDTFGHVAGDKVLAKLGEKLAIFSEKFLVARVGGEEFYVLMPGVKHQQALQLTESFRRSVNDAAFDIGGDTTIKVTCSAGVSNEVSDTLDEHISVADRYLYKAKMKGRNKIIGDFVEEAKAPKIPKPEKLFKTPK